MNITLSKSKHLLNLIICMSVASSWQAYGMDNMVDLDQACKVFGTCIKRGPIGPSPIVPTGADLGAAAAGMLIGGPLGAAIGAAPLAVRGVVKICEKIKEYKAGGKLEINKVIWGPTQEQREAVAAYLASKEPIVIAQYNFNNDQELKKLLTLVNQQLPAVREELGKPSYNGKYVELKPRFKEAWRATLLSPKAGQIELWATKLTNFPVLFEAMEKSVIISNDVQCTNKINSLALLTHVLAHCADAAFTALYYPIAERLEETEASLAQEREQKQKALAELDVKKRTIDLFATEALQLRGQKQKLQADFDQEHANFARERDVRNGLQLTFNQERDNFIQERNVRNQLQTNFNQEQEQKRKIQADLEAAQKQMNEQNQKAAAENLAVRRQAQDAETALAQEHEQRQKTLADLEATRKQMGEQSQKAATEYDSVYTQLLPLHTRANELEKLEGGALEAIVNLDQLEEENAELRTLQQQTEANLAQEREQRLAETEALRKKMAEQNQKAKKESATMRSQLKLLRRKANKVSPLHQKMKKKEALIEKLTKELGETRARYSYASIVRGNHIKQ